MTNRNDIKDDHDDRIYIKCGMVVASLPLVKSYKQKYYIEPEAHPALDTFARLKDTLMKAKEQKKVFLFLFAFFFYY